jgi:hypothetical protein
MPKCVDLGATRAWYCADHMFGSKRLCTFCDPCMRVRVEHDILRAASEADVDVFVVSDIVPELLIGSLNCVVEEVAN